MQNENLLKENSLKSDETERKIERLKFCIITSFKSQRSRNNLLMFTLDNPA